MKKDTNIFSRFLKNRKIVALTVLIGSIIISWSYIILQKISVQEQEAPSPREEWEEWQRWAQHGAPSFKETPLAMRGSFTRQDAGIWLYHNVNLGFEIESISDEKSVSFEHVLDDSPYNTTFDANFSGLHESMLSVSVSQTRFSSLDQWLAANPAYASGSLYVEQWTVTSGEKAVVTAEKGDYLKPPTFEEIRRRVFIIKDDKLYTIDTIRISEKQYKRLLDSFKFVRKD